MGSDLLLPVVRNISANGTTRPVNAKRWNSKFAGGKPCLLDVRRDGVNGTIAVFGVNLCNPWRSNEIPANPNILPAGVAQQQFTRVFKGDGVTQVFDADTIPFVAFSNFNWQVEMSPYDRFPIDQTINGTSSGFAVSADAGTGTNITFATETFSGDGATTAFTMKATTDLFIPTNLAITPPNQAGPYFNLIVKVGGVTKVAGVDYNVSYAGATPVVTFVVAPPNAANNITLALAPVNGLEFAVHFVAPVALLAAQARGGEFDISGKDRYWVVGAGNPSATDVYIKPAYGA